MPRIQIQNTQTLQLITEIMKPESIYKSYGNANLESFGEEA
jgi:hypothetical protein